VTLDVDIGCDSKRPVKRTAQQLNLQQQAHPYLSENMMQATTNKVDVRTTLTTDQNEILNEFINEIGELTPKQRKFCDVRCMLRYLRARDWDVKKALKLLQGSFEWRDRYQPENLDARDLDKEASNGKVFQTGFDKKGQPIVYMIPANNTSEDYDKGVQLLVYTMEKAIESMPEGVEQLVWFIDFKGFSRQNSIPLNVAKETISILSDQYPERLAACYFVDAPFIFNLFYKTISVFVNPNTRNKVNFVSGSHQEKRNQLAPHFDMTKLHTRYGGDVEANYDHAAYWKPEMEKSAQKLALVKN
jgi:hypothetical protein